MGGEEEVWTVCLLLSGFGQGWVWGGRWVLDVFLLSVVTSENYGIPKRMFCIFLP